MKAVISNRIYMSVDEHYREELNSTLTHVIPARNKFDPPVQLRMMGRVNDKLVTIPGGRKDLIPLGYEIVDRRVKNPAKFPNFPKDITLRPSQQEIYDEAVDNCIINAKVGWGKTFVAICLAKKFEQKTLVVVHNTGLRDQWVKDVKSIYGFTPGTIGSGKFDISTPIVVGNTQTLYNVIPQISREFGTLIVDEVHHTPANTFSKIIDASHATYKIGLSGTLVRKDGFHVVIPDYFGHKVFSPKAENVLVPQVHVIKSDIHFPDGPVPWALKNNELASSIEYQELVVTLANFYASKGHKVLVVSDRTKLLTLCQEQYGDKALLVVGETDNEIRGNLPKLLEQGKDVIFATQQIFSEGISVNQLGVLILATPINNEPLLEQLIGRVIRKFPGKLDPIIVDIKLKGRVVTNQANQRLGHYMRQGYRITHF